MTKRFRISQGYNDKFCHDWEKNKLLNFRQTVDLLNELVEENTRLKKEIETGKEYCKTLETDLGTCADNRILLQKENNELAEENKRLQRCINEIYTIARLEEV